MLYGTVNPHGGDVYGAPVELDFSSNVNPLGTPPSVIAAIQASAAQVCRYPDPYCRELTAAIARHENVKEADVLCGAGAAELIYTYCDAVRPLRAAELAPTFSEYSAAAAHFGAQLVRYFLRAPEFQPDAGLLSFLQEQRPDVLFLCTPNNPTGRTIPRELLEQVLNVCRGLGTRVLLDECFLDFTDAPSASRLLEQYPNLLILKAFTKNYALAGVRVGYVLTADTALLSRMAACSQPWNVSIPAQAAGTAALRETQWPLRAKALLTRERAGLTQQLEALGCTVCPSEANYLLFHAAEGLDAALRREKIAIRNCENYPGLGPGWYRIAVKLHEENMRLMQAMQRVKEERSWH